MRGPILRRTLRIKMQKLRGGNDDNITEQPMSHQSPFNKAGWAWTKHGWKRIAHRPNTAKKITVRRRRPKQLKPLTAAEATRPAAHSNNPDASAKPFSPNRHHLAGRHARQRHKAPLRPSWGGKYADLHELHNDG
jgi:hypothetical protein